MEGREGRGGRQGHGEKQISSHIKSRRRTCEVIMEHMRMREEEKERNEEKRKESESESEKEEGK